MQIDAAQHLVAAEGFSQAADRQRQAARGRLRRAVARQPCLFDEIRALHRLGAGRQETKGFLHAWFHLFLEGRMPGQRQPLQRARGAVGELSQKCVDQD